MVLAGVDIAFVPLVFFLIKLAIAAIPALILFAFVLAAMGAIFGGVTETFHTGR